MLLVTTTRMPQTSWRGMKAGELQMYEPVVMPVLFFIDSEGHPYPLHFPNTSYIGTYAIPSSDGRHLAFVEYTSADNVWMIENF